MGRVWFEKKNVDDDGDAAGHIANDELAFSRSSAFGAVKWGIADVLGPIKKRGCKGGGSACPDDTRRARRTNDTAREIEYYA